MIYAMVEYINKNGKITVKGFLNQEDVNVFTEKLGRRNVKYLVTIL